MKLAGQLMNWEKQIRAQSWPGFWLQPNHAMWMGLALGCSAIFPIRAAEVDLSKLPSAAGKQIDFDRDIKAIFESSCFKCHGPEKPKSKFRLDNRESALKGGENGIDIVPGHSAKSPLIHYVTRLVEDMEMPPEGKGEPLTKDQISLLRAWIDQGAQWPANALAVSQRIQFSVSPAIRSVFVTGNARKFSEHWWMRDGTAGGVQEFTLKEDWVGGKRVSVEGRGIFDDHDYTIKLNLEKAELGFVRSGFQQYRKYSDDTGGAYPPFGTAPFQLQRDLHLDVGRAWVDLGLTLPDWPQLTLGYEHQYRDGSKSTLQWGPVTDAAGTTKAIYPAFKGIDEQVHIIKADLKYERRDWSLEDNFRAEFYDLNTYRENVTAHTFGPTPDSLALVNESQQHFQGANTFHLERQLKDWFYVSGGYFFSGWDGEASFREQTVDGNYGPIFGDQWFSQQIVLEQQSHVFSLATMLGPWQGLTLSAAVQNDLQHQEGLGYGDLNVGDPTAPTPFDSVPISLSANTDKQSVTENIGLRYTKIPFTVLYAETRLQREKIGQFEQQAGGAHEFLRDTDAIADLEDYRTGFTLSPWPRVSLNTHYKRRLKDSDYNHMQDVALEGDGYPAFIRERKISSDEAEAKLTWRAASAIKLAFFYRLVATDYRTVTDPVFFPAVPGVPPLPVFSASPGGGIFAGNYDAHVYSVNAVLTPARRLYCSTTFSYGNSRTVTAQNGTSSVVPYAGDTYSVLTSVSYALNPATSLHGWHSFSRADYGQNNTDGVPLGLEYDRHGMQVGVSRQFKKTMTATLKYGFFQYSEPLAAGLNDYTAHAVFATLSVNLL